MAVYHFDVGKGCTHIAAAGARPRLSDRSDKQAIAQPRRACLRASHSQAHRQARRNEELRPSAPLCNWQTIEQLH